MRVKINKAKNFTKPLNVRKAISRVEKANFDRTFSPVEVEKLATLAPLFNTVLVMLAKQTAFVIKALELTNGQG